MGEHAQAPRVRVRVEMRDWNRTFHIFPAQIILLSLLSPVQTIWYPLLDQEPLLEVVLDRLRDFQEVSVMVIHLLESSTRLLLGLE